ncbi:mucin-20 isoform X2 [Ictidomys tridecemlineatus]
MSSVRGLVLPLLFFCWENGVLGSSADDSSEETKRMVAGSWTSTQISPEAESLSSESSSSADSSVSVNTTSHILSPDAATRPKALVAYSITHIEFTRGSVMKIETVATISGTSEIEYSPTGVQAEPTSETSALSTSTEAKSHIPKITASAETLSTASTSESASPDSTPEAPLPTSGTTERETAAAQTPTPTPSGTLVAGGTSPWEETSALSAGTTRHLEVSGPGTCSTDAGSMVGTVTSSAGPRASVYSSSEAATIQVSTPSETFATEGTTTGSFPTSRSPLPSAHPSIASSSQETHFTFSKATAPPESPTATPTTAQTRQTTEVPAANTLWATTPGTLDSNYSPTGVQAMSTSETSVLSTSTEAKSHVSRTTASAETWSTASASESASPDSTPEAPVPTSGTTERETAAAQTPTPTPSGTLVAGGTSPWEETSALSAGTTRHLEVSGPGTRSTDAGSTVGTVTSSAGPRASVYSSSEAATIQVSTPSETFATEGTTTGSFPTSRSPLPSAHPSIASSSQETHFTFSKATAPPESPTATPTTAQTRQTTEVPAANTLWATTPGTLDSDYSPTGVQAVSTSETSALSASTEAKSHIPKITASAETLSTASASESASPDSTPETPLPTSGTTERETAAAQTPTPTPSGTLVAGGTSPWEETSALSAGTTRHLEVSGPGTRSTDAGSMVGTVTSSVGPRASVYSSSEAATIQVSTPSETFATEGTTTGSFPTSRSPLPSAHPSIASSSQETHFTFSKATAPPESPTATPTTAQTRQTTEIPAANTLWATTPGTLDSNYSPTGVQAMSTSETSALSASTEAKSHVSRTTASAETWSTASASESASPDSTPEAPVPTSRTTERETAAAQTPTPTPSGTLVAGGTSPWEETSALSAGTTRHLEVSGPGTRSTDAGSTVGTVTSSAGPRASVYSSSEAATIQVSTPSETFATEGTTTGSFPTSRSPLPSAHPSIASSSQETHFTFSKATAPPESPTATPTTAQTRQTTEVPAGGDGGFLLVRLSVASPADLTEPSQADSLMQQLRCELHTHLPLVQVSLLRVRRG